MPDKTIDEFYAILRGANKEIARLRFAIRKVPGGHAVIENRSVEEPDVTRGRFKSLEDAQIFAAALRSAWGVTEHLPFGLTLQPTGVFAQPPAKETLIPIVVGAGGTPAGTCDTGTVAVGPGGKGDAGPEAPPQHLGNLPTRRRDRERISPSRPARDDGWGDIARQAGSNPDDIEPQDPR